MRYELTTRKYARAVPCPRCGAIPGKSCWGARKPRQVRKTLHADRHAEAIARGAPIVRVIQAGPPV